MATIKYRLKQNGNNSEIYLRFSIQRGKDYQVNTGYKIDIKDWVVKYSKKPINKENPNRYNSNALFLSGEPKQKTAKTKQINESLRDLSSYVLKSFDRDIINDNININTEWLKTQILKFKKGIDVGIDEEKMQQLQEEKEKDILISYINKFYELRKLDSSISPVTNQKFKTLLDKVTLYQKDIKTEIKISSIDKEFLLRFKYWLMNDCKLMESTANRTIKNLKTILLDASNNGIILNPQIYTFKLQSIKSEKVFLSFEEIEQIKNAKIIGENNLTIAHDWLIIGCYTGQRVSDLLRMDKSMIYTKTDSKGNSYELIELTQQKTGAEVSIPMHSEVKAILKKYDNNFPPVFSQTSSSNETLFNRYIKQVCQIAGINTIVKGKVYDEKLERNVIEEKEKYNFVSSHICRRSFATNFYADARFTTPQIMAITGHRTEHVFLEYIGKKSKDYALNTAETFAELEKNKNVS